MKWTDLGRMQVGEVGMSMIYRCNSRAYIGLLEVRKSRVGSRHENGQ
jgi:hypothetical protein